MEGTATRGANCPSSLWGLQRCLRVLSGTFCSCSAPAPWSSCVPVRLSPHLCPQPRVCLLTRAPVPLSPCPQVTPPCTWRPSTATRSASASCCRYQGQGGREVPRSAAPSRCPLHPQTLRGGFGQPGGSQLCLAPCGSGQSCSALPPRRGAAVPWAALLSVLAPAMIQALSLRPPAPWMWLTAVAGQRCTTQVSGDGAGPVLLTAPRRAALSPRPSPAAVSGCISCSEILCDFKAPLNVKDKVRSPHSSPL